MRKLSCSFILILCSPLLFAQSPTDSGTYFIHKFQQKIGSEKYTSFKANDGTTYNVHFNYVDRGQPVDLIATMRLTPSLQPLSLRIKGGTSRFSAVDDSIVISGQTAFAKVDDSSFSAHLKPNSFPVAGYSPATVQRLLIQYWKKQASPANVFTLPFGTVQISRDGEDTVSKVGSKMTLQRFVIKGLIWGNELVWTDRQGQLICLITNDAEGDKQEIVYEPFESLLPVFIDKAAFYGMRLFKSEAKLNDKTPAFLAITGGNLLDLTTGTIKSNTTILIENGKIKSVASGIDVSVPKNAVVIDAKGKTILPGLWDMHAHFEQAEWGPAYLAAGVTTVRDCGNEFGYINAIKNAIDQNRGIGPRILKAGLIDGKGPTALGIIQADTKEEGIAAVQRYKENGFVQIKIYSSVKPVVVKAICDEAHRLQLTVTGHVPNGMTLIQGVDSGMNMINHLQYVYALLKRNPKTRVAEFGDSVSLAALHFIKSTNTVIDPTLGVFELIFRSLKDDITTIEPAFSTLPAPLRPLFANTGTADSSRIVIGKAIMQSYEKLVYELYKMGVPIVAGTDMGFPGLSVFRELELYVEGGLTPLEALRTATTIPAKVMNLDAQLGSVDQGKDADIILIDGNPLENIRNIRKVAVVIKAGKVYDPKVLHKLAGFGQND